MDKFRYAVASGGFVEVFKRYEPLLSGESREHVNHLLDNAELEMACESFILSMIDGQLIVAREDRQKLLGLCHDLRLDHESVFRSDFWNLARSYLLEDSGIH